MSQRSRSKWLWLFAALVAVTLVSVNARRREGSWPPAVIRGVQPAGPERIGFSTVYEVPRDMEEVRRSVEGDLLPLGFGEPGYEGRDGAHTYLLRSRRVDLHYGRAAEMDSGKIGRGGWVTVVVTDPPVSLVDQISRLFRL